MIHLFGKGLGQKGSTLYAGFSCANALTSVADAQRKHTLIIMADTLKHFLQMCTNASPSYLFVELAGDMRRSLVRAIADINVNSRG